MRISAWSLLAGSLLLVHLPLHAQTSRPAAPVVTAGANLKEINFDWDPVPGAHTYWLLERKKPGEAFTRIGEKRNTALLMMLKWRESVAAVIRPGATTASGKL